MRTQLKFECWKLINMYACITQVLETQNTYTCTSKVLEIYRDIHMYNSSVGTLVHAYRYNSSLFKKYNYLPNFSSLCETFLLICSLLLWPPLHSINGDP